MEERCRRLQEMRVRNIQKYNEIALGQRPSPRGGQPAPEPLPHIVILIDELADLMFATRGAVEGPLVRLAQKARAVGIHLVVATQRPSVDVITGLIKANFPSRVAFQVSSKSDSRIIIDYNGAECLLGRGDMLFSPGGALKPVRLQGAFVSEEEVEHLVEFLRSRSKPFYMREDFAPPPEQAAQPANTATGQRDDGSITDDLYFEALRTVVKHGQATQAALTSSLNIGRTNAGRLLDRMEREGFLERRGRFRELAVKPEAALERIEQRSPLSN
jgi:DNA segregation ATPase FtsK/SpoIIIE, S-DNA-T family